MIVQDNFLRRWSQRKLAAARQATPEPLPTATPSAPAAAGVPASAPAHPPVDPKAIPTGGPAETQDATSAVTDELPPVETLRFDSDFTRFLAPKVDETVKRQALRKLFSDPRFNVMDGLDVYIDDYSKFEPIPDDLVGKLRHARYIFDPPKTRVNEAGHVEDVPDEPPPGTLAAAETAADAVDAAPAPDDAGTRAGDGVTADVEAADADATPGSGAYGAEPAAVRAVEAGTTAPTRDAAGRGESR